MMERRALDGVPNPGGPGGKPITLQMARQSKREIENYYASFGKDPEVLKKAARDYQTWTEE